MGVNPDPEPNCMSLQKLINVFIQEEMCNCSQKDDILPLNKTSLLVTSYYGGVRSRAFKGIHFCFVYA